MKQVAGASPPYGDMRDESGTPTRVNSKRDCHRRHQWRQHQAERAPEEPICTFCTKVRRRNDDQVKLQDVRNAAETEAVGKSVIEPLTTIIRGDVENQKMVAKARRQLTPDAS